MTTNKAKLDDLSDKLLLTALPLLERGNKLTKSEKEVLLKSSKLLIYSLFSSSRIRIAIALPTGFGKSTLIRSLVKLIKDEGIDKKVLVCVNSHAEILESIEDYKDMGIGGDTVGVYMSKNYVSDWDTTDIDSKAAIYISHSRVYNVSEYEAFSDLFGKDRLFLWDESAQTSKGAWVNMEALEEQVLGLMKRMSRRGLKGTDLYKWLTSLDPIFDGSMAEEVNIKKIEMMDGLTIGEDLRELIKNSGCKVSVNNKDLVVRILVKIPDEINCIIFDASAKTRKLIKYDKSITAPRLKIDRDYSLSTIECVNVKSSKSHLDGKDNLDNQIERVKEWMEKLSIAPEELLIITQIPRVVNGKMTDIPRQVKKSLGFVHIITWGSERGVNQYKDIKYTANIGMKWRDRDDLSADIVAQQRDLTATVDYKEIDSVQSSEFLSEVQQWIPRTNMRKSNNGVAMGTEILFQHPNATELAERLEREVFKGLKVKLYEGDIESTEQEREKVVKKVSDYLLSCGENKVSTVRLKKGLRLQSLTPRQWKTISKRLEDKLMFCWRREGKSWSKII